MIHLLEIQRRGAHTAEAGFPFNVPIVQSLDTLHFEQPVTFLVGENGSGKSTLLETLACAVGSITVGAQSADRDKTLAHLQPLAKQFKLVWAKKRNRKGFFMRSEDFFGYVKRLSAMREEMQNDLKRIDREYADRSDFARGMAKMSYARELKAMTDAYGEDGLDANSHGESYFTLFKQRFVPGGVYLLDEPEAPLSPQRQLAFISMLHEMVKLDSQFIIATHSPIIMAYPNANILSFDGDSVKQVAYDDLEHVTLTRSFLNDPAAYLRHLIE